MRPGAWRRGSLFRRIGDDLWVLHRRIDNNRGMARAITEEEVASAQALLGRARAAMAAAGDYDQATVDRLCQAVAAATANEDTFGRLTRLSVEESGMGSAE